MVADDIQWIVTPFEYKVWEIEGLYYKCALPWVRTYLRQVVSMIIDYTRSMISKNISDANLVWDICLSISNFAYIEF